MYGTCWSNGDIMYSGKKQKCIVKFKGGLTMICSPIHKFNVRSKRGSERFVECKDLLTLEKTKNAHRVVVNPEYAPSDHKYSSNWAYKYKSNTTNANNVFLEDIGNSYSIGVVLGRLASDGTYSLRDNGSYYIEQIIAEHEFNILPILKKYMQPLGVTERSSGIRENRNEEIINLDIYSASLTKEVFDLDIKHQVHKNIFMDTELLRGFLCGFFDGNGGISGKTITLTFGKQYEFEPMILDMQKALLFFGIRSRYRKYDDRYVLAIKTTDNERFLDIIGFINKDKQDKGSQLNCKESEHTFGRCLIVESVEITDEYIDMYDVCNTDGGYYVADGVITHNTAADIYKMAVGRVFKRVCREGWLGKVIFTGFIHDELLGEVSNDINPGVFLKALREEFEVKITNPDGTPWCPLYMGFGYGMSWYEAKSVELPIKLQWEFVEKYGETGFPDWNGNGRQFCDTIPDRLRDFEVRDIRNQLYDTDSQGKEIKPTLNKQILDCMQEDAIDYVKYIDKYLKLHNVSKDTINISTYLSDNEEDIEKYLDKTCHIQKLYKVDDNFVDSFEPATTTQDAIDMFCVLHDTDRSKIDIRDIQAYEKSADDIDTSNVNISLEYYDKDDEVEKWNQTLNRVKLLGLYPDVEEKKVYLLRNVADIYLNAIAKKVNKTGDGYKIVFIAFDEQGNAQSLETASYLPADEQGFIRKIYTQALQ